MTAAVAADLHAFAGAQDSFSMHASKVLRMGTQADLKLVAVDEQRDGFLDISHGGGGEQLSHQRQGLRQHPDEVHSSLQGGDQGSGLLYVAANALTACRPVCTGQAIPTARDPLLACGTVLVMLWVARLLGRNQRLS